ncbi:lectin-like domain-containing protein [Dellaglioa algida]|uniref:lectin-like domain-containing protein n=1 Tax=Dellaglioa algida TaxID=105612 RepID=UPI000BD93457|nr:hypothetical protein [Dellaglioa algida]MDK1718964.1 hypothetical protein [Dellaglioa algida]MDK1730108.1 hypothetical protein [Dellaglioa algida]MDK1742542.1 hypothetical protein [Dellaglioa algida]SOB51562.1 exported hypothetical protein [Dellaglioa algida]
MGIKQGKLKVVMFTIAITFFASISGVSAVTDYPNAIKAAPHGITLNGIFQTGTGTGVSSASKTVNLTPNNVITTDPNAATKSVVTITDDKNQKAAVWSTDGNTFDINKDETASMWVYLGNGYAAAGDGMALVLQNDPKGNKAISTGNGETLGVWADDILPTYGIGLSKTSGYKDPAELVKNSIQNSWALEFDTHDNSGQNSSNSFDTKTGGKNHLASGYPADESTYQQDKLVTREGILTLVTNYFYHQNHLGLINYGGDLSNGQWHHVTLKYVSESSTKGTMMYSIDDKDPKTNAMLPGKSLPNSLTIDKSKFNSNGSIRWGFTGSTGASYETNLVMFEQVPGLVNASATQKVTDITQKNKDVTNNGLVQSDDSLSFVTDINYSGGKQEWKNINASLKIPNDVTLKSGTITYSGAGTDSETINLTNTSNGEITKLLKNNLSLAKYSNAKITLLGTANKETKDTVVHSDESEFTGSNAVVQSNAASFTIGGIRTLTLTGINDITVKAGSGATIAGTVVSSLGGIFPAGTTTAAIKVNDNYSVQADVGTDGKFSVNVPSDQLKLGKNPYTVMATDQFGNQTKSYTANISVGANKPTLTLDDSGKTVNAPYSLSYHVTDDSAKIKMYYQDGSGTPVLMDTFDNPKANELHSGAYKLPDDLSVGKHVITVYAVDSDDNKSDTQTITVMVPGKLGLTTAGSLDFGSTDIPDKATILSRKTDFSVDLETSLPGTWDLSVSATDLTSGSNTIKGAVIYRATAGDNAQVLNQTGLKILSGSSKLTPTKLPWDKDAGVLIKADPSQIHKDAYTARVSWVLTNTPSK